MKNKKKYPGHFFTFFPVTIVYTTFPPWLRFSFKKKRPDGVAVQDRDRLLWTSLWWYTEDQQQQKKCNFSKTKTRTNF